MMMMPLQGSIAAEAFNCSEPPNFNNFDVNSCCRTPEINLNDVPQRCQQYIKQLKSANENYPAYAHICYPECIYRETGALVNGQLNMVQVKRFLMTHVHRKDRDILPEIERSFEKCLANIKGHMKKANIEAYNVLPHGCSPFASMIYSCVNAETFLHCPAKMWKSDRNCLIAKQFAEQCNPLPHVPLPMN
ncbi:uncharacterized protein LOC115634742 [Scaptodrosophila lebanonensis]|uniref:Uncharacterized protein LOC115634742 n=1 Tax=Drosophila lebanonensis TaxID=7225 RepID=A0A6J2UJW8_DROLE|nr:uncharacterized protein LOC115634742 [Scaptodrosophila lebanonensis]